MSARPEPHLCNPGCKQRINQVLQSWEQRGNRANPKVGDAQWNELKRAMEALKGTL